MPNVTVNEIDLYYEAMGHGAPMLLLHGACGTGDSPEAWMSLAAMFGEHYRGYRIDARGHGRSTNNLDYLNYELMADDYAKFIEAKDLAPAILVGISDGAINALVVAMRHPELVSAVVAVGANYYNDELAREANADIDLDKFDDDDAAALALAHDRGPHEPGYWKEVVRQNAENLAENPNYTKEELSKIEAPTLLISGELDKWANRQQMLDMRDAIPNSEMLILNNGGHDVQATHPHLVGPAVLDFLSRKVGK